MGRCIFTIRWFWAQILCNLSESCFSKNNYMFIIYVLSAIIFLLQDIFHRKLYFRKLIPCHSIQEWKSRLMTFIINVGMNFHRMLHQIFWVNFSISSVSLTKWPQKIVVTSFSQYLRIISIKLLDLSTLSKKQWKRGATPSF